MSLSHTMPPWPYLMQHHPKAEHVGCRRRPAALQNLRRLPKGGDGTCEARGGNGQRGRRGPATCCRLQGPCLAAPALVTASMATAVFPVCRSPTVSQVTHDRYGLTDGCGCSGSALLLELSSLLILCDKAHAAAAPAQLPMEATFWRDPLPAWTTGPWQTGWLAGQTGANGRAGRTSQAGWSTHQPARVCSTLSASQRGRGLQDF